MTAELVEAHVGSGKVMTVLGPVAEHLGPIPFGG